MAAAAPPANDGDVSAKGYSVNDLVIDTTRTTAATVMGQANGKHSAAPDAVQEHGRTYHGYNAGAYHLPNDPEEQARLDHQHRMTRLIQRGKLGLAPVKNPKTVVDICTGTGVWALEYAAENPKSTVIGCDLSEIQPKAAVPNCSFTRLDVEKQEWNFPAPLDYAYLRYVVLCFDDMPSVLAKAYASMAPDGYIELFDADMSPKSLDGSVTGTALEEMVQQMTAAGKAINRDFYKPLNYEQWLKDAGFVDVVRKVIPAPVNDWAVDSHQKEVGRFFVHDLCAMYPGLGKFLELAGNTPERAKDLTERVTATIKDPNVHCYYDMLVVYGRKPRPDEVGK